MQIFTETFKNYTPDSALKAYCPIDKCLYFDIETTGLSKEKTSLYLIGIGYYLDNDFITKLLFIDTPTEELELIEAFFDILSDYTHVIHFNGTKFDLPYIDYKCQKYGIENKLNALCSVDIYQIIKPLRYLMFPVSMRQKFIEDFLDIKRDDKFDGGQLISVYHDYCNSHKHELLEPLLTHNKEDVLGMHKITPILNYVLLLNTDISFKKYIVNEYKDINNESKNELMLICKYPAEMHLPKSFSSRTNTMYLNVSPGENKITMRLNIYSGTLKHFFENYRDYYYLPIEDRCIHKSFADGVDKKNRIKASRQNCFDTYTGDFVCQMSNLFTPTYKEEYKSKRLFFPFPQAFDERRADEYVNELFKIFIRKRDIY